MFLVTERTRYPSADYYLQTGSAIFCFKIFNFLSLLIWCKRKSDLLLLQSMVVIPMVFLAKIFKKKVIYIESSLRYDASKTGKLMYKYSDLFIVRDH